MFPAVVSRTGGTPAGINPAARFGRTVWQPPVPITPLLPVLLTLPSGDVSFGWSLNSATATSDCHWLCQCLLTTAFETLAKPVGTQSDELQATAMSRADNIRRAFTLTEALVSTAITAMAGSALLLGVASSIGTTKMAQEQTIAAGLAQQFMDEIAGNRYMAVGASPYDTYFGPSSYEMAGTGRSRYNDLDDFHGVRASPPKDAWNRNLGTDNGSGALRHPNFRATTMLSDWRAEIDLYYVSNSNLQTRLATGQTSNYRAVEVRILADDDSGARRTLTTLRRVFAYVPAG